MLLIPHLWNRKGRLLAEKKGKGRNKTGRRMVKMRDGCRGGSKQLK
jgi:hypothetical protein